MNKWGDDAKIYLKESVSENGSEHGQKTDSCEQDKQQNSVQLSASQVSLSSMKLVTGN
jgi:hypothetical protein